MSHILRKTGVQVASVGGTLIALLALSGCCSTSSRGVSLRTNSSALTLASGVRVLTAPTGTPIDRDATLKQLDADFMAAEVDMRKALGFITTGQVKDYKYRKDIGFWGVLLGAAATTLNAASKANIVYSTAFTAVQTGITGYLGTSDGLVNPNSNQQLTQTKQKIEDAYNDYQKQHAILLQGSTTDTDWATAFTKAEADLSTINFQCFSVLPTDN